MNSLGSVSASMMQPNPSNHHGLRQTSIFTFGGASSSSTSSAPPANLWSDSPISRENISPSTAATISPSSETLGQYAPAPFANQPFVGVPITLSFNAPTPKPSTALTHSLPSSAGASDSTDRPKHKRSKVSSDASPPFDTVENWIKFEADDDQPSCVETTPVNSYAQYQAMAASQQPSDAIHYNNGSSGSGGGLSAMGSTMATTGPATGLNETLWASMAPLPESPTMTLASASQSHGCYLDDMTMGSSRLAADEDNNAASVDLGKQLSSIESMPPTDVPPREGCFSTPLSWERPQVNPQMDALIGLNAHALNEAEQRRLIAIALNAGPTMGGLGSHYQMNYESMNTGMNGLYTCDPLEQSTIDTSMLNNNNQTAAPVPVPARPPDAQERPMPAAPPKKQASASSEKGKEKMGKSGDRAAHNDIERKYRTNLKDKIAELRDAIPSLQTILEEGVDDGGSGDLPARGPKISKGTVLTKATEYIHYLERQNRQIVQQHNQLSRQLQTLEHLVAQSVQAQYQMPNHSRTLFDPRAFC